MKNKYIDLIEQTFDFPQAEFEVIDNELYFHKVPLMDIIKQYGTPLKISYLPKITSQIQRAKILFNVAMAKVDYQGEGDHFEDVAVFAARAVVKRLRRHFMASGGSVIIPSLSTPAWRTSDITSTTNP